MAFMKDSTHIELKVGDIVHYSRQFLRTIGDYSYETANLEGKITSIKSPLMRSTILLVEWQNGTSTSILASNLVRNDRLHLEAR